MCFVFNPIYDFEHVKVQEVFHSMNQKQKTHVDDEENYQMNFIEVSTFNQIMQFFKHSSHEIDDSNPQLSRMPPICGSIIPSNKHNTEAATSLAMNRTT